MTQYNNLHVKFSDSQLNKLKLGPKNGTEVSLKLSSNVIGNSNDANNFLHKLFLTNTQVSKLRKTFANNFSANINLSKMPIRLAAVAVASAIHQKMFGLGVTTLIISNEEINDIMNVFKCLDESGLLTKGVSETIKNGAKEQKDGFLGMLLRTLGISLLGNL